MAEFNLFGNATKDQIRVAYISTERGLVDNVTVVSELKTYKHP